MSVVTATGAPSSDETFLPEADGGYEPSLLRSACALPILGIGAYIVTSMFYVFPSGAPQPADVILLACIPIALLLTGLAIPYQPLLYVILGLFVTWVTLVNVSWFLLQGDYLFLKKTSFYFYNSLVFVLVLMVGARDMRQLAQSRALGMHSCPNNGGAVPYTRPLAWRRKSTRHRKFQQPEINWPTGRFWPWLAWPSQRSGCGSVLPTCSGLFAEPM